VLLPLARSPVADDAPGAAVDHEGARVERLPAEPVRHDRAHRREQRVDELVDPDRPRKEERGLAAPAVDPDLAAGPEREPRGVGPDPLAARRSRRRGADGDRDPGPPVLGRDEQRARLVDALEPQPVGAGGGFRVDGVRDAGP
jgi:hypothetical protein